MDYVNKERYEKNFDSFSQQEFEKIQKSKVCVVGCGGLGGFVSNALARFGVGHLTIVDGDIYSDSNLNRQLFSTEKVLGEKKALIVAKNLSEMNSSIIVNARPVFLEKENVRDIIKGHDLIIDCLDNIQTRLLLAESCQENNVPLVHGAISGFYGQVAVIHPGDKTMDILYRDVSMSESAQKLGNPVFTPQLIASIQCSEALKYLAGKVSMRNKVLYLDLSNLDFEIVDFSDI